MKKQILTIGTAVLFTFGSATFIGCGEANVNQEETEQHDHADHEQHAEYQCPMDCEEGKTYDEPGKCPVCKMDLKEVEAE